MSDIRPFADDARVVTIGDLAIENGTEAVVIHGDVEIRRDKEGLAAAMLIRDALAAIVDALQSEPDLPDRATVTRRSTNTYDSPFDDT